MRVERIKRSTSKLEQMLSFMDHQIKYHHVSYQVLGGQLSIQEAFANARA
jgi:hypothetical protein